MTTKHMSLMLRNRLLGITKAEASTQMHFKHPHMKPPQKTVAAALTARDAPPKPRKEKYTSAMSDE